MLDKDKFVDDFILEVQKQKRIIKAKIIEDDNNGSMNFIIHSIIASDRSDVASKAKEFLDILDDKLYIRKTFPKMFGKICYG